MDWISIEPEIQALTPLERRVLELLNEGHHYFRIAGMLHLSFETVRAIIFNIRKKESVLMGKLTNTEKAAIFQAWKDGASQADLAKQYKVSGAAICALIKRLNKAESEIMQTEDKPERMEKVKPVKINHEFEDAVDKMIAESKSADKPEQLEDCENGIPNTPLVPAEIEKEISVIAEEKSTIAESGTPDREQLPPVVRRAVVGHLNDLEMEIEAREERIAEIKCEIAEFRKDIAALSAWKESQKW